MAMLGKEAAMTCTVAVEDVIEQHYNRYNTILWMQHDIVLLYYTIRSLFCSQLRQLLAEHHKEEQLLQVYVHL